MNQISVMLKPASSLCNMRCRYCFYEDVSSLREVKSYGLMQNDTAAAVIRRTVEWADEITYAFQGGEPTLAGLPFFVRFTATVDDEIRKCGKAVEVHYHLQTNGLLIDGEWCVFLKKYHFLVSLSMDGTKEFHDRNRLDTHGKGTYSRIHRTKQIFDRFKIEYNLVWALTGETATVSQKSLELSLKRGNTVCSVYALSGTTGGRELSMGGADTGTLCSFYSELLQLWMQDLQRGQYRSIKFFDDLFNMLLYRRITACGFAGQRSMQFI